MSRPKLPCPPAFVRRSVRRLFFLSLRNEAPGFPVSRKKLRRVIGGILSGLGWERAAVSVLLLDDRKIREINRRYLGHDRPTDVIAFSQAEGPGPGAFYRGVPFLGDLAVSVETAERQSEALGTDFFYELCLYLCHGVLHLMGYDDRNLRGSNRMRRKQESLLSSLGIKPGGQSQRTRRKSACVSKKR